MDRLKANEELILEKANQGFTKLLLVPFAYSLDDLINACEEAIRKHNNEKKLLATKNEATEPDKSLVVGEMGALLKQGFYTRSDIEGKIVYFPREFSKNHKGKTKLELLRDDDDPANAWPIWLLEDMPNIPKQGEGKIIGGRRQLEAGKSPDEYLKILQTEPEYEGESGLTPEVELMLFLTYLEETNQVINDYEGNGSTSCQIGAYFKSADFVPHSLWFRYHNQLWLNGVNTNRYYLETGLEPRGYYSNNGTRFGVKV
jgi:hypothetical protein